MKFIKGYEGRFSIDIKGNVYSHMNNAGKSNIKSYKLRKQQISIWGYPVIDLVNKNRQRKKRPIHRLVALTYIKNPLNRPCINHKDGNKQNNNINNLEWVTYSENEKHSRNFLNKVPTNRQKISAYKDGILIGSFISITEAAKQLKVYSSNISKVLANERAHTGGYQFERI